MAVKLTPWKAAYPTAPRHNFTTGQGVQYFPQKEGLFQRILQILKSIGKPFLAVHLRVLGASEFPSLESPLAPARKILSRITGFFAIPKLILEIFSFRKAMKEGGADTTVQERAKTVLSSLENTTYAVEWAGKTGAVALSDFMKTRLKGVQKLTDLFDGLVRLSNTEKLSCVQVLVAGFKAVIAGLALYVYFSSSKVVKALLTPSSLVHDCIEDAHAVYDNIAQVAEGKDSPQIFALKMSNTLASISLSLLALGTVAGIRSFDLPYLVIALSVVHLATQAGVFYT